MVVYVTDARKRRQFTVFCSEVVVGSREIGLRSGTESFVFLFTDVVKVTLASDCNLYYAEIQLAKDDKAFIRQIELHIRNRGFVVLDRKEENKPIES